MDQVKCKICGERHALGSCPKFKRALLVRTSVVAAHQPSRAAVGPAAKPLGKPPPRPTKPGGRPRTVTKAGEPWVKAGISRATWYREQKGGRGQ
jgi:hypothetical protein